MFGLANRQNGGETYIASFNLTKHVKHADDLFFFFGLHWLRDVNYTLAEQLMDKYYPQMIKNFVRTGNPDKGIFLCSILY